jgi:hypothetical protein
MKKVWPKAIFGFIAVAIAATMGFAWAGQEALLFSPAVPNPGHSTDQIEIAGTGTVLSSVFSGDKIDCAAIKSTSDPDLCVDDKGATTWQQGMHCGVYTSGVAASVTVLCQGHNPKNSCPSGFVQAGGDYQSPGNRLFYTCVKE